jgi:hypothetical protein
VDAYAKTVILIQENAAMAVIRRKVLGKYKNVTNKN